MKNITLQELRELVESEGLRTKTVEDCCLVIPFDDEEVGEKIMFNLYLKGSKLKFWAIAPRLAPKLTRLEKLRICNDWNTTSLIPNITLDKDDDFVLQATMFTDEEFSPEYFKDAFLQRAIVTSHMFLMELKEQR